MGMCARRRRRRRHDRHRRRSRSLHQIRRRQRRTWGASLAWHVAVRRRRRATPPLLNPLRATDSSQTRWCCLGRPQRFQPADAARCLHRAQTGRAWHVARRPGGAAWGRGPPGRGWTRAACHRALPARPRRRCCPKPTGGAWNSRAMHRPPAAAAHRSAARYPRLRCAKTGRRARRRRGPRRTTDRTPRGPAPPAARGGPRSWATSGTASAAGCWPPSRRRPPARRRGRPRRAGR
mmetsp:Transcript_6852/g.21473  ORF Transcript_6852/g.21473 Transcript_6852/m.21473 type:complete len:235 (+) Transcript_6852:1019-1723(+)